LDVVDLGQTFPVEGNPWHHPLGLRKFIVMILPFLPKLWDFQYRFFINLHLRRASFRILLREAGPRLLQGTKSGGAWALQYSKGRVTAFQKQTRTLKIITVCLILVGALTAAFIYRSFTSGVLPDDKEYLMASLEEWSVQSFKYDPETEMDSFYDSPRTIQNIMSLPKMVVNLHPSETSGPNPMAALEFFLEGLSPEAIVEVKDREAEIRDLFQRTIEEMTYGELESTEGKQQLAEKLRQALNAHLTKGKIRRVFFKEAVIKP
jgi:flagellar basal body-associated protein FliL